MKDESYDKYVVKDNRSLRKKLFPNLPNYHYVSRAIYLKRNCNECVRVLDVGAGPLKNITNWKKNNINEVYAIEPSKDYYLEGLKNIEKSKMKNIKLFWGVGELDWEGGEAGLDSKNKKLFKKCFKNVLFNCITFEFSIHYMINNYVQLLENINRHSMKGTKLLIYTLDGEFLYNFFKNNNKYTIKKGDEVIYEITCNFDKNANINSKLNVSVFFKGVHGLENTPTEDLVIPSILIKNLKKIKFELKNKKRMAFISDKLSKKLLPYERRISNLHMAYVFEKME
jgi:hypothetical protein